MRLNHSPRWVSTARRLGVYGQTKAAGDAVVSVVPRHNIVRTSWVIGEGNNFVRTMASLAARGIEPSVVNDQIGRLSFTADIAAGIRHLLESGAAYGTYNLTNDGEPQSWADIAADDGLDTTNPVISVVAPSRRSKQALEDHLTASLGSSGRCAQGRRGAPGVGPGGL
jgi:dTDP-4-dehydrorhamnose reductase